MRFFGLEYKIFGGGMQKVDFILPYVENKDVIDLGVVAHKAEAYENENWLHKNLARVSNRCVGIDILEEGVEFLQSRGASM